MFVANIRVPVLVEVRASWVQFLESAFITFMVSKKKNAFNFSVNVFSRKVLIGEIILAPTGDYPWIPRGGQLSRKKQQWPIIDPILVTFGQNAIFSIPP